MKHFKDKNQMYNDSKAHEISTSFHSKPLTIEKNVQKYIIADINASIEQYKNGECIPVDDFMAKYRK